MTQHIAISGKGGVGKTTIAANLAAALAEENLRVILVGCDAKADSSALLCGTASMQMTLLQSLNAGKKPELADVVAAGYRGIGCVEVGDSSAEECPGDAIGRSLALLHEEGRLEKFAPDFVLYDIPGEMGCTGIATYIRAAMDRVFVAVSADLPSLVAANAFLGIIGRNRRPAAPELIANVLSGSFEESLAADFARQVHTSIAGFIPRSLVVRHCELYGKTVMEGAPHSQHATIYRRLARHILEQPPQFRDPTPLPLDALKRWATSWGERLGELEFGILKDGAGI